MDIIIRRKRIRNIYIRVKPGGKVEVSAPLFMPEAAVRGFIESKKDWISRSVEKMINRASSGERNFTDGEKHWYFGKYAPLVVRTGTSSSSLSFDEERNIIDFEVEEGKDREKVFKELMREKLRTVLEGLISYWAPRMGVNPGPFRISSARTRWGSCNTATAHLNFVIELAAKPIDLIESVVVHELTHLKEASHNQRFYRIMGTCLPDYKERRKRLNNMPREFL